MTVTVSVNEFGIVVIVEVAQGYHPVVMSEIRQQAVRAWLEANACMPDEPPEVPDAEAG